MKHMWLCLAVCVGSMSGLADAQSLDEQFLAGLQERQLFGLAERYCRQQIAQESMPPLDQAEWVARLMGVLADEARSLPSSEGESRWQAALAVPNEFRSRLDDPAFGPILLAQRARVQIAWAELLVARGELSRRPEPLFAQARDLLRDAITELDAVNKSLVGPLPKGWTSDGRFAFQTHLSFEQARAYKLRGRSYPAASADRADALNQAETFLRPIVNRADEDPIIWKARLDLVEVLRRQERLNDAARILNEYRQQESIPAEAALRLRTEAIRLAVARGEIDRARQLASAPPTDHSAASADLALASLEMELAAWMQGGSTAANSTDRQRIAAQVRLIERDFGPYWGQRARSLETSVVASRSGDADATMLAELASEAFHNEQFDQAVEQFARAHKLALAEGDAAKAFEWGFQAAAIEHRRRQSASAAEHFLTVSRALPEANRAAEAHAWAIYHTGLLSQVPDSGVSLEDYEKLLREHIAIWPRSATVGAIRIRLGKLLEVRKDLPAAAEQYAAVTSDDAKAEDAVESLDRVSRQHLESLRDTNPTAARNFARQTVDRFRAIAGITLRERPARLNTAQQKAALSAGQMLIDPILAAYPEAVELFDAARQASSDASPEWRALVDRERILALVGAAKTEEAMNALAEAAGGDPETQLGLITGLLDLAERAGPQLQKQLGEVQLQAVDRLRPQLGQLDERQKMLLDYAYVRARSVIDPSEAVADYQALMKAYPRERRFAQEAAELMMRLGGAANLSEAERLWRLLGKTTPGSDRWLEARYHLARTLQLAGNTAEARKVIDLTGVLAPDFGGGEWKAKFEALQANR